MKQVSKPNVIVNYDVCIADKGCRACIDACPLDIIAFDPKEKTIKQVYDECWYCLPCENDCPVDAIRVEIPYQVK